MSLPRSRGRATCRVLASSVSSRVPAGIPEDPSLPPLPPLTTTALFFPDSNTPLPVVIATGSQQWTLAAGEELQSVTLQQLPIAGVTRNFALATTNQGRILAVDTLGNSPAFQVFDIVDKRKPVPPAVTAPQCNLDPQRYGLRASNKSGRVYLTDRNYCQAVALESVVRRRVVPVDATCRRSAATCHVLHICRVSAGRRYDRAGHRRQSLRHLRRQLRAAFVQERHAGRQPIQRASWSAPSRA